MLSQVNICHANVDASIPLSLANSPPMTSLFSGRCSLKESSSAARVILRWTRADHEKIEIYEGAGRFILRQGEKGTAVDEIVASGDQQGARNTLARCRLRLKRLRVRRQSWSIRAPSSFRAERLNAHF
jgi:hypothetical protein